MIKLVTILCLFTALACNRPGRGIASASPQYSFKLYAVTKYLPRSVVIFQRNYTYQGQILITTDRPLLAGEAVICKSSSYAPGNVFAEQIYPIIGETSIALKPELNTVACEITGAVANLELKVSYMPHVPEDFARIEAMINVLKLNDLKFREMEPSADLCAGTQVAPKKSLTIASKLIHGSVGQFCGTPVAMQTGVYTVACDAARDETWNGYVNMFNDKMLLLNKTKLLSPNHDHEGFEWTSAVDHVSKPIVINKQAIFVTNDGRMIIFAADGSKIRESKLAFLFLSNPQMLEASLDSFAILGATSISDPEQKSILIFKANKLIKTVNLNNLNEINSFVVFSDFIYLVTAMGELLQVDFEGQIIAKLQIEKNRLSPMLVQSNRIIVGSESGRLYEIDRDLKEAKIIYRAFYNGGTDFDVGSNSSYAIRPNFTFAPAVLKNGKIVVATENDGRIHFLDQNGKLEKIVSVPYVRDLLGFGVFSDLSGDEFISASSISYLSILSTQGDIVAESISTGAEIYDIPRLTASGQFLMGMYNGVFRFKLDPVVGKTVTTKIVRPCP